MPGARCRGIQLSRQPSKWRRCCLAGVAMNARVVSVLDDAAVRVLDEALAKLTAQAVHLNAEVARDVRADRRARGSRKVWGQPRDED